MTGSDRRRISVAISTFNRADYLALALESLKRQSVSPFEILIQNDGGTDDTENVVRASGLNIRYYYWENRGLAASRNHLLSLAEGDWILFLDDDDLLADDALEAFYNELADPQPRILYCRYRRIDSDGNLLPTRDKFKQLPQGDAAVMLFSKNFLLPSGTLLPVAAVRDMDELFPVGQAAEDYDFFLRLALKIPVQGIDRRLVFRRRHRRNISSASGAKGVSDQIRGMDKFLALAGDRIPKPVVASRMAEMYARLALALKGDNAPREQIRAAWRKSLDNRFVLKNFLRMLMSR